MLMRDPLMLAADAVDDVAAFLRIDTPDDDALIASLAASAVARAEDFCAQMLIVRNVTERIGVRRDWQPLGAQPVQSIAQLNLVALDGTSAPLNPSQFSIDIDGGGTGWVRFNDASLRGRVDVLYTAGLVSNWDALPEGLRHAVVRLAAYLYTSRDSAMDAGPPAAVVALLRPYRRMRLK